MTAKRRADLRGADSELLQIVALQSRVPDRVRQVLDRRNPVTASTLPYIIELLGVRAVAADAMQALEAVVDRHPGALIDALLDDRQTVTVRRRLARVLSTCRSQTVADGLLLALDRAPLEVRVHCGRSLYRIRRRCADVRFDSQLMMDVVRAELERGAPSLAHLFTLLAFLVPVSPLRAAYRSLRSRDARPRGEALEYMHGVVPEDLREPLMKRLES